MIMGKKSRKADGARCRRHRQQAGAGICPLCLRERLSRLSPSESLPSVVARDEEEGAAGSSCSDSEAASSASVSGSASPGSFHFHHEMRRGARVSLLMKHERVVAVDGDEVVGVVRRRRRRRERTSLWAKLLRATTGGGGRKGDGCSLAHSKTLDAERSATTKWILF